jgi:hypothetical protein
MPSQDMTQLLVAWSQGDRQAVEILVPLVEAELHRLARLAQAWLHSGLSKRDKPNV